MKLAIAIASLLLFVPLFANAETVIDIEFPVDGEATFQNDFLDSRSGGRSHGATDIMADKMTPILAVVDGEISFAPTSEPSYGWILYLEGDDGYRYVYIHINNDTPGTDDGQGGIENAYAPGIRSGVRVDRGQHIAWVGDSGNAESTNSHLHFEIWDGETRVNPYESLVVAQEAYENPTLDYDPAAELARATSINTELRIADATSQALCESDTLIKSDSAPSVYYCGADGGRYVFQNESVYFTWYPDFDDVETITTEKMASIPLKGMVTYKPGSYMVKVVSSNKVYAVSEGKTLRWVPTETMARRLYGDNWSKQVRDLSSGFFSKYSLGNAIESQ